MERITEIKKGDQLHAAFFCGGIASPGARFLTKPEDEFQLGVFERQPGYEVKPHTHPPAKGPIGRISEFLYIEKGKVEVSVYDDDWSLLGKDVLGAGDFLLFLRGGHSLKVLEAARMIEVKQGPYPGDERAKVFRSEKSL